MLDVNDLVEGVTKVRILVLPKGVEQELGDVGIFQYNDGDDTLPLRVHFEEEYWFFDPDHLEIVGSEDLIIYKSRWDEIVENLSKPLNTMTDEEAEVVKSVLKNNVPYSVVNDPVIVDQIIEKKGQTHLDVTHIGDTGNASFYYKSEILKKWFWWSGDHKWVVCDFNYEDCNDLFPITISK